MIHIEFTEDEAQALADFIWGEEADGEALRSANDKLTTALDEARESLFRSKPGFGW
jgi:hypothetical protein